MPCYGLPRNSSGTLPTDRQFQGQQNQSAVGLYPMGARWYDPTIGLWTQPDTLVPNPMDPLALNRYASVEGNPLRRSDPSGHDPFDPDCEGGPSDCESALGGGFSEGDFTDIPNAAGLEAWLQQLSGAAAQEEQIIEGEFREIANELAPNEGSPTDTPSAAAEVPSGRSHVVVASDPAGLSERRTQILDDLNRRLAAIGLGPYAGDSVPARASDRNFTLEGQKAIDAIGQATGCHTCGRTDPDTASGHFILDHQPATKLRVNMAQRLYPQCLACSQTQGGRVAQFMRLLQDYLALDQDQGQ